MLCNTPMALVHPRLRPQGVSPLQPAGVALHCTPPRHLRARSANAQTLPVTGGEVLSSLVGSPILRLDGTGARVVPLLLPQEHTLPFAVALHMSDSGDICNQSSSASPPTSRSSSHSSSSSTHEALLELHYVLSGSGHLVLSNGEEQPLVPGDSVIVVQGSAQLLAGPVSSQQLAQHGQQAQHGADAASLVTLQVLLPAALLTDTASSLDGTFQPRAATGAQHWLAGRPEGRVTPQLASQALGGQRRKEGGLGQWPGQSWQHLQRQLQGSWSDADELSNDAVNGSAAEMALDALLKRSASASSAQSSSSDAAAVASAPPSMASSSYVHTHGSIDMSAHTNSNTSSVHGSSSRAPGGSNQQSARNRSNAESRNSSRSGLHAAGTHGVSSSSSSGDSTRPMLHRRALRDAGAFKLPNQTNRLALLFGPEDSGLSLSFALEIFEPNHRTAPHVHKAAHELFFVLAGEGQGFAGGKRFPLRAGDCAVFPPGVVHGIDLPADDIGSSSSSGSSKGGRLYCLQMMTPNEAFVEFVHSGEDTGSLEPQDLCTIMPSLSFC